MIPTSRVDNMNIFLGLQGSLLFKRERYRNQPKKPEFDVCTKRINLNGKTGMIELNRVRYDVLFV
jgi:hypothetical protein